MAVNNTSIVNPFTGKLQIIPDVASMTAIKDPVDSYNDLPITGNGEGDVRIAKDTDKMYVWSIPSTSGSLSDWKEIGAVTSIDWSNITGKPTSTPTNIDDAVTKKHTQGTDQGLDTGGVNAVTASQIVTMRDITIPSKMDKIDYYSLNGQSIQGFYFRTNEQFQILPSYPERWTLEFWFKLTSIPSNNITLLMGNSTSSYGAIYYNHQTKYLTYRVKPTGTQDYYINLSLNTWNHVCIQCYNIGYPQFRYIHLNINGVNGNVGAWESGTPNINPFQLLFGADSGSRALFQLADIRYSTSMLYASSSVFTPFTPPTTSLTVLPTTTLLIRFYNNTINATGATITTHVSGTYINNVPYVVESSGLLVQTKTNGNVEPINSVTVSQLNNLVQTGIVSTPSGDWKKVTSIEYNATTQEFRFSYDA